MLDLEDCKSALQFQSTNNAREQKYFSIVYIYIYVYMPEFFFAVDCSQRLLEVPCRLSITSNKTSFRIIKQNGHEMFIFCSHNKFSSLPVSVTQLQMLKVLLLNGNILSKIPEEFGQLQNVDELVRAYSTPLASFCLLCCLCTGTIAISLLGKYSSCQRTYI